MRTHLKNERGTKIWDKNLCCKTPIETFEVIKNAYPDNSYGDVECLTGTIRLKGAQKFAEINDFMQNDRLIDIKQISDIINLS